MYFCKLRFLYYHLKPKGYAVETVLLDTPYYGSDFNSVYDNVFA